MLNCFFVSCVLRSSIQANLNISSCSLLDLTALKINPKIQNLSKIEIVPWSKKKLLNKKKEKQMTQNLNNLWTSSLNFLTYWGLFSIQVLRGKIQKKNQISKYYDAKSHDGQAGWALLFSLIPVTLSSTFVSAFFQHIFFFYLTKILW